MAMFLSNRLSYPKRLFLWLLGYSALLVGCFIAFQYHREKEFKIAEIDKQLQLINTYILNELADGQKVSDINLSEFQTFPELRLSVISSEGNIIYDNSLDSLPLTNHLDRQEIRQALLRGSGYAVRRHSQSTGNSYFYSARLGSNGHIVRTAVPYSVSLSSLLQADLGFIWVMGFISVAMCILGYFATRRVGQHITKLNRFAQNVEKGDMISDTEPFPHDELGEISNHIVRLYVRLQKANADRDREHRSALHEQLEKERIKKQLTNNINHELKTPVSSIRICIETLLAHRDMPAEKEELFLQRCLTNTDRLQRLLSDVALLTRMDDGNASIETEPVCLSDIIGDVVEDRRPLADSKGMAINNMMPDGISLTGNISLLETIFSNLIDNAIAYSGASEIEISLISDDSRRVVIALSDNGCGVSPEHLPRLFERFYRVDKGRSRAAGGTGLGLAIVKNAVIFHHGTISVDNITSGGLRFVISLPKQRD